MSFHVCAVQDNPFYEVLFHHSGDDSNWGRTCRVQQERAWERAMQVGTRLLLKASAIERIIPDFRFLVSAAMCFCAFLLQELCVTMFCKSVCFFRTSHICRNAGGVKEQLPSLGRRRESGAGG